MQLPATYYGAAYSASPIKPECQGFALDGLRYSPGGSVLPDRCSPFNATTNNPYAVRCIDVFSHYKTEYPGDSSCILPPPPELGVQIGVHPQGPGWLEAIAMGDLSAYTQASDEWRMQPGEEETVNYRSTVEHEAAGHYYRIYYRMRSGSHHMIITAHDDATSKREVWFPSLGLPGQFDPTLGTLLTTIGTAQRPDDNSPQALEKPVEDEGLYNELPRGAAIIFNMHHFNSFDRPLLKEAWVNVFWEDDARTAISPFGAIPLDQVLGLSIPAGKTVDLHYAWTLEEPLRIVRVFAHRHAWTPNFSVWIVRAGHAEPQPIYQSFNWSDVPTYRFDSLTMNPALNPNARGDGGASGVIELAKGDELHFSCHITFTDERALSLNFPKTATQIGTLDFANEAYDAEMCVVYGGIVGTKPTLSPEPVSGALPTFATVE
jgi:hypothetical protein